MVAGIAKASAIPLKVVRRALMLSGSLPRTALTALTEGAEALAAFSIELFNPLQPMLAQTAEDAAAAIDRLGDAIVEWKLDGARVQVHRKGDVVKVYSRRMNEVTPAVPEVVEIVGRCSQKRNAGTGPRDLGRRPEDHDAVGGSFLPTRIHDIRQRIWFGVQVMDGVGVVPHDAEVWTGG